MTMTLQLLFDNAAVGVIKQGKPSVDANGKCKYRTKEGLKCGIGFSITDEEYAKFGPEGGIAFLARA